MRSEKIGTSELWHGDCMELMARYPDGHFDLAIVDPPYGGGNHSMRNMRSGGTWYAKYGKGINAWDVAPPPDNRKENMLTPETAPVVAAIVNLFAEYKLPIIARDKIFEDVKLVMDSRLVEPVEGVSDIINLDELRREYAVCRHCDKPRVFCGVFVWGRLVPFSRKLIS